MANKRKDPLTKRKVESHQNKAQAAPNGWQGLIKRLANNKAAFSMVVVGLASIVFALVFLIPMEPPSDSEIAQAAREQAEQLVEAGRPKEAIAVLEQEAERLLQNRADFEASNLISEAARLKAELGDHQAAYESYNIALAAYEYDNPFPLKLLAANAAYEAGLNREAYLAYLELLESVKYQEDDASNLEQLNTLIRERIQELRELNDQPTDGQ